MYILVHVFKKEIQMKLHTACFPHMYFCYISLTTWSVSFFIGFKVIKTSELSRIDKEHTKDRTKVIINDYPCVASIELSTPPTLIAINCDNLCLAVAVNSAVFIYDVRSFFIQVIIIDWLSIGITIGTYIMLETCRMLISRVMLGNILL